MHTSSGFVGTVEPGYKGPPLGQYFLAVIHWVTCLCSDPVMYWDHLGLSLLIMTGIDQKSGYTGDY